MPRPGISHLAGRKYGELSSGQKQRVHFALAICGNPDLLFLDEPTVGLDVESRRAFWQEVRALVSRGRAILLTTHYLEEADALADRVVVMNQGAIVADGAPHEMKQLAASRRIRCATALSVDRLQQMPGVASVRRDGAMTELLTNDAERVTRDLLIADASLSGLEVTGAGLEEAFLALTSSRVQGARSGCGRCAMNLRCYVLEAKYEFLKHLRMPAYAIPSIVFPVMFYLLFGVMFGGARPAAGTTVGTYMMATYSTFGVIGAALFGFGVGIAVERGQGWMTLKRATPMPPMAYFLAKVVMAVLFGTIIIALIATTGVVMAGVRLSAGQWVALARR